MNFIYGQPLGFWIVYGLAVFGFAYIAGHSKITLPLRVFLGGAEEMVESAEDVAVLERRVIDPAVPVVGPFLVALMECPACLGFWEGAFFGYVMVTGTGSSPWLGALMLGCATSGFNFILARATGLI